MDLAGFQRLLQALPETIRESLAAIENAAQSEEDPRLFALSRAYASLLHPIRDYLMSAQLGRPFPRRLAKHLSEQSVALVDLEDLVQGLRLHPDLEEITRIIQLAETVT